MTDFSSGYLAGIISVYLPSLLVLALLLRHAPDQPEHCSKADRRGAAAKFD